MKLFRQFITEGGTSAYEGTVGGLKKVLHKGEYIKWNARGEQKDSTPIVVIMKDYEDIDYFEIASPDGMTDYGHIEPIKKRRDLDEGYVGKVLFTGTVKELEAEARKKGFRVKWDKGYGLGPGNIQPDKKVELIGDPEDSERLEIFSVGPKATFLGRAYDAKFDSWRPLRLEARKLKEDEGAGAPANSAGTGNIAGLGVGKAGKPANWGEPSPRKRRQWDEGDKTLATAMRDHEPVVDGSTREMPNIYHPEPDYQSHTDDELDVWLRKLGFPKASDWKKASQPETPMEGQSEFDYSNDTITELYCEGMIESVAPQDTFAGAPVFEVDMEKVHNSRFGKNRYHRYSRYVGEDEVGEKIRKHGRTKGGDIILKDAKTSVMTYLRRKHVPE